METALNGLLTPVHPGAERFYKDLGLLKQAPARPI